MYSVALRTLFFVHIVCNYRLLKCSTLILHKSALSEYQSAVLEGVVVFMS